MVQHSDGRIRGPMIQSVQRASRLLKAFDGGPAELGVSELSRMVRLHKSTVSRLLATLEHEGLLERAPGSEKYRLGRVLVRLAGQAAQGDELRAVSRPLLVELAERSRETVHLAVLDGDEVVNVEQIDGPHLVREANWVGRRTPLHPVANGKALLAFGPPELEERALAATIAPFTDRTIIAAERLRAELAVVRERGYATALGEIEEGLHAVAAPVRDRDGRAVAAVSISGPAYRMPPERLPELGALCVAFAARITARLA